MSNRVYKSDLSVKGIDNLISQLKHYADVDLAVISDKIVQRLAEVGMKVAEYSVYSDWRSYIEFRYERNSTGDGELVGQDNTLIHRVWYTKSGLKSGEADISPLLMSEYGAGFYALAGHRGTFPGQHNAWKSVFYWTDANGVTHSSEEDYHMIATQPMYKAFIEMMQKAESVVREVFSEYVTD